MLEGRAWAVDRPWLTLYSQFSARWKAHSHEGDAEVALAPIQHLPYELQLLIMSRLPPYTLGKLSLVCKQWNSLVEHPKLWEHACVEALQLTYPSHAALAKLQATSYRRSWKRLFLEHPHVRFDGLYVSRNMYVKTGVREWNEHYRPVHVVVYFRYYRFFPDGRLLYRTSPATVSKVARSMAGLRDSFWDKDGVCAAPHATQAHVFVGRYLIKGTKVFAAIRYPNNWSTEIRCRMTLRSSAPGAFNRLDMESILSFDRELGVATALDGQQQQQQQEEGGGPGGVYGPLDAEPAQGTRREHQRGLNTCVFVPWDQVHTSVLNLPASQMDFFCP